MKEVLPYCNSRENAEEEECDKDFDIDDMPMVIPSTFQLSSSSIEASYVDCQYSTTGQNVDSINVNNYGVHLGHHTTDDMKDGIVLSNACKRQRDEVIEVDVGGVVETVSDVECPFAVEQNAACRAYNVCREDIESDMKEDVFPQPMTVQGIFKSHWARQGMKHMPFREIVPVLTILHSSCTSYSNNSNESKHPTAVSDKNCMFPLVDCRGGGYYVKRDIGRSSSDLLNGDLNEERLVSHSVTARYQMSPSEESRYKRLINIENWSNSSEGNHYGVDSTKEFFPDVLLPSAFVETVNEDHFNEDGFDARMRDNKEDCKGVIDSIIANTNNISSLSTDTVVHTNDPLLHQEQGRLSSQEKGNIVKSINSTLLRNHQIEGIRFIWKCLVDAPLQAGGYGGSVLGNNGLLSRTVSNIGGSTSHSFPTKKDSKKLPIEAYGCILAHSMGLGKSCQVIVFLNLYYQYIKKHATVVLVAPKSTLYSWRNEFKRWSQPFIDQISDDPDVVDIPKGDLSKADDILHTTHYKTTNYTATIPEKHIHNARRSLDTPFPLYFFDDQLKHTAKLDAAKKWAVTGGVLLIGYDGLLSLQRSLDALSRTSRECMNKRRVSGIEVPGYDENPASSFSSLGTPFVHPLVTKGLKVDMVVCDEAHKLKNNKRNLIQGLNRLNATMRLLLTGTPLQNHLMEYWTMLSFVIPNFFENRWFEKFFVSPILRSMKSTAKESDIFLARRRIFTLIKEVEPFVQRMDAAPLKNELPPLYEYVVMVGLSPSQKRLYVDFMEFVMKMKHQNGNFNLLQAMSYSNKICAHPKVLYSSMAKIAMKGTTSVNPFYTVFGRPPAGYAAADVFESSKFIVAVEIIKLAMKNNEKTLVFSISTLLLDVFQECLVKEVPECRYSRIDGGTRGDHRATIIKKFQKDLNKNVKNQCIYDDVNGEKNAFTTETSSDDNIDNTNTLDVITDVLLLSTKAGGVGLTLTAATRVIILDSSYNPTDDRQAIGRVYRYGQRNPVYAYRLICEDTMEHRLLNHKVAKEWLFRSVVDGDVVKRNEFLEIHLANIVEELWGKHRRTINLAKKCAAEVIDVDVDDDDGVVPWAVDFSTSATDESISNNADTFRNTEMIELPLNHSHIQSDQNKFSHVFMNNNVNNNNIHTKHSQSVICFRQDPKVLLLLSDLIISVSQHECFFEPDDEKYGESELEWYDYYRRKGLIDKGGGVENGNLKKETVLLKENAVILRDKTIMTKENRKPVNEMKNQVNSDSNPTPNTRSLSAVIDHLLRKRREKQNKTSTTVVTGTPSVTTILLDDKSNTNLPNSSQVTERRVPPSSGVVPYDVPNNHRNPNRVVSPYQAFNQYHSNVMIDTRRFATRHQRGKMNVGVQNITAHTVQYIDTPLPSPSSTCPSITNIDSDDDD